MIPIEFVPRGNSVTIAVDRNALGVMNPVEGRHLDSNGVVRHLLGILRLV